MPHRLCKTRFFRDTSDGVLNIHCSCGWKWQGHHLDLDIGRLVQEHRATFPANEPPLKQEGFVSGLSDNEPGA